MGQVLEWLVRRDYDRNRDTMRAEAADFVGTFRSATARTVGPHYVPSARVTNAVRTGHLTHQLISNARIATFLLALLPLYFLAGSIWALVEYGPSMLNLLHTTADRFYSGFHPNVNPFNWEAERWLVDLGAVVLGVVIFGFAGAFTDRFPYTDRSSDGLLASAVAPSWQPRNNYVPYLCALLVISCARARSGVARRRGAFLQGVDLAVCALAQELVRLPADPHLFHRNSCRRKEVRRHVHLVAAALQQKNLRLDTEDADTALIDIAGMALRICDAYVERHWGSLLAETQLTGIEPIHEREAIRVAAAGLITVSVSYLAAAGGVSAAALPLVIGLAGVISFNVILGRTPRALELLDSIRGIQRP
ncbi:hypothetical protein [Streptomyces sp. NPDC046909]|uniref:hypothetical protein n=1 Tax=Streptomyces sp. NPDC046909 TaxID=3155617 RepID=UPI0033F7C633